MRKGMVVPVALIAFVLILTLIGSVQGQNNMNARFGTLNVAGVTATSTELNVLDGVVAGTATANKGVVLGPTRNLDVLNIATATITDGTVDALGYGRNVTTVTATDTLLAAKSGHVYVGKGMDGKKSLCLPSAAAGLEFVFIVDDSDSLLLTTAAEDTLMFESSGWNKYKTTSSVAGYLTVTCIDTKFWYMDVGAGTWTSY